MTRRPLFHYSTLQYRPMFIETAISDTPYFIAVCLTVVISICIHELSHGFIAILHGDHTPVETGHWTLDPSAHLGIWSIMCLLLSGIAWGAMPVNPTRMRGRHADFLVSFAGPLSNALLALITLTGLGLWFRFAPHPITSSHAVLHPENLIDFIWVFGVTNINLALFNLIPIPPLDGSHMLACISRPFARLLQAISATGAIIILYILLFSVLSNYTSDLAVHWALRLVQTIRSL